LQKYFGFNKFKGQQEEVINNILAGNDTFVIMPTGGGKSLCYQLPALVQEGTAIVVSPLIALMKNQVDAMRGLSSESGGAHVLNSSLTKSEINEVKKDVTDGLTKLLYVAPESLTKDEYLSFLQSVTISFVAIDEAHCISEWGHDFRPEYRRLRAIIEEIDRAPIIALTATATPKVQQDILKNLGMADATLFKDSFNRSSLYYEIRPKVEVNKEIIRFIPQNQGKSGIIYCQNRKKVEELAELLQLNGISAVPYHAGLDSKTRNLNPDLFLHQEVDVIVATIAFGMGIDKPDIRFIIHHDIPKSLESYYQETGRAGRDGGEGICVAFYDYNDVVKLEKLLSGKPLAEQEIHKLLLQEVVSFAESGACRRQALLHYFGEHFSKEHCNDMCDNCAHPKETFPAKDALLLVFDTLLAMKGKYKMAQVLDVIQGRHTNHTETYRHTELAQFGKGKDKPDAFWLAVMRQALVQDFLSKEVEHYGTLLLNKKALSFIESPCNIDFYKDRDFQASDSDESSGITGKGGSALDTLLLSLLKDLRKQIARQRNLPPFVIFQDFSLDEMATAYPINMDELKQISGVGEGKAMKFGKPFVDLIARHVEENDIDRPMDLGFKSVANKSAIKVAVIQSIDRKIPLDVIARNKDLELADLIHELEAVVQAGIRLDLDYYVNKLTEEEELQGIFELLRDSEDADLQVLIDEYGDVYSEEELRILRVKFLSDMGN